MDADKILQRAFAEMRREMPRKAIVTRSTKTVRSLAKTTARSGASKKAAMHGVWLAAAATIAVGLFLTIRRPAEPEFVCWVGGQKIENRDQAMEIARQTFADINSKMERPAAELRRINEILNLKNE